MTLPNHIEMLDKLYGKAYDRKKRKDDNKRAVMARLPPTMLADLRQLHAAFGTRATWIQCDGETLLGEAPERDGRVEPLPQYLTPSQ